VTGFEREQFILRKGMIFVRILRAGVLSLIATSLLSISRLVALPQQERGAQIVAALREQRYDQALQMLHGALLKDPGNAELWTMQGVAYNAVGNKEEALADFRHALKLSPDAIPALQGAAQIEYDNGSAGAVPILEHLLRLRPNDQTSHGMLAVLDYQHGNCSAAVTHFEQAASLFDSRAPALHAFGICLVKLGQVGRAADVFRSQSGR
jgi:cytochrome c-type biogenesis protein CcmH/NrfG